MDPTPGLLPAPLASATLGPPGPHSPQCQAEQVPRSELVTVGSDARAGRARLAARSRGACVTAEGHALTLPLLPRAGGLTEPVPAGTSPLHSTLTHPPLPTARPRDTCPGAGLRSSPFFMCSWVFLLLAWEGQPFPRGPKWPCPLLSLRTCVFLLFPGHSFHLLSLLPVSLSSTKTSKRNRSGIEPRV